MMQALNNKKVTILLSLVILLTISNESFAVGTIPSCTSTTNGSTGDCYTTPDIQLVTFTKAALCKSQPVIPTKGGSSNYDMSMCTTFFENVDGSEVAISKTATYPLTGNFTSPPAGEYLYVYVEIKPFMKIKTAMNFSTSRTDNAGNSGVNCWTLTADSYSISSTNASALQSTKCSDDSTHPGIGMVTHYINDLGGNGTIATYGQTQTFTTSKGDLLTAFSLTSSNTPAVPTEDHLGTVNKIVGYIPQRIVITGTTKSITINYNNSQGTKIQQYSNSPYDRVYGFGAGPFDFYLSAE